jgi:hypothetical protein
MLNFNMDFDKMGCCLFFFFVHKCKLIVICYWFFFNCLNPLRKLLGACNCYQNSKKIFLDIFAYFVVFTSFSWQWIPHLQARFS